MNSVNIDVDSFEQCLLRLKEQLGFREDQQVAELLGMKKAAFSSRKKRDAFPVKALTELARQRPELGIDLEFVFNGRRVVLETKPGARPGAQAKSQVAAYTAPIRDAIWLEALEAVIDWLNARGKRVPGHKVIAVTDLIADHCRERGMDEAVVERTLRLVA